MCRTVLIFSMILHTNNQRDRIDNMIGLHPQFMYIFLAHLFLMAEYEIYLYHFLTIVYHLSLLEEKKKSFL